MYFSLLNINDSGSLIFRGFSGTTNGRFASWLAIIIVVTQASRPEPLANSNKESLNDLHTTNYIIQILRQL